MVAIQTVQNYDNKIILPVRFVTRVGYRVAKSKYYNKILTVTQKNYTTHLNNNTVASCEQRLQTLILPD